MVRGDSQRLRQVFWNLLINACQAMPDGGEIRVSALSFSHEDQGLRGVRSWWPITDREYRRAT